MDWKYQPLCQVAAFYPTNNWKQSNQGEASFVLEHFVLLSKTYFREKNMLIESSDHFAWMNSYSSQDFCDVLFCGILCLLLYNACGTGYSNWFCWCKHLKYYIFIKRFIFNDVRKLLLGHKNTALWTFQKRYVELGLITAWF